MTTRVSFRDPAGTVFRQQDRILRLVQPSAQAELRELLQSEAVRRLTSEQRLVGSRVLAREECAGMEAIHAAAGPDALVVEHPAIAFPSYPYEWSPGMLLAAGSLTLDMAEELLDSGWGLKDASPYNVLFEGTCPVFVDVLSIERRDPGDSTWLPYAQFQRNFVLPLLANRYFGLSLAQTFLARRDGLEPESVYRLLKGFRRFRPPFLGAVSIPTWLGRRESATSPPARKAGAQDPEKAQFILRSLLRHLRRQLRSAAGSSGRSHWSDYAESNSYSRDSATAKESFVAEALRQVQPRLVLDVGCNTGRFSGLAARAGSQVVAIDYDEAVIDQLQREASAASLPILPLVANLARPSPALGWRNCEQASFLDRARGRFDLVLALAVLHHMLVTDGIPLDETIDLFASLSRDAAVIEFVAPADPMFRKIARGRDALYTGLTQEAFEASCARHFETVSRTGPLEATRWLYLFRRRTA